MDILCTRCGEPWDVCSLTDDMTPQEAKDLKAGRGCPCCSGKEVCQRKEGCSVCPLYQMANEPMILTMMRRTDYYGRCRANAFKPINEGSSYIQRELASILGDDIDGLAAAMEDFNLV